MMQLADGEVVWFWRSEAGAKSAEAIPPMTVATKRWSPRRARISRNPLRRECRVDPVYLWFLPLCFFIAQGAMGASGARHSLRPLVSEGRSSCQSSGALRREIADSYPPSLRGALLSAEARLRAKADATKQSTLSSRHNGLLRSSGGALRRPAMTVALFDIQIRRRDGRIRRPAKRLGFAHVRSPVVSAIDGVGWAKRSVPTASNDDADGWWARRVAPLPTLRSQPRHCERSEAIHPTAARKNGLLRRLRSSQ
jgi:hypothetical protein